MIIIFASLTLRQTFVQRADDDGGGGGVLVVEQMSNLPDVGLD